MSLNTDNNLENQARDGFLEETHSHDFSKKNSFDAAHVLHELKHFLPSQTPIKDFIHHNSLHAYQHMKFFDAIFKASKIFGYQATLQLTEFRQLYKIGRIRENILDRVILEKMGAANLTKWKQNLIEKSYEINQTARIGQLRGVWKHQFQLDLDAMVQPLLFRILAGFLDQGVSIWPFPVDEKGLLASIKKMESNGLVSLFKTEKARNLLKNDQTNLESLLKMVVGDENYFEQYLFDQQFSHQGWSGLVSAIEDMPQTLLDSRTVSYREMIELELLLEIDALEFELGKNWQPLTSRVSVPPTNLFADVPLTEFNEVCALWQMAFEWSYYDQILAGMTVAGQKMTENTPKRPSFQAMFCIDEREDSLRRHVESSDLDCETIGTPGFFGVEFYFQSEGGQFYDKLCPAPVTPKFLIKESGSGKIRPHELLYTPKTNTLLRGSLATLTLGFAAAGRLFLTIFRPKMSPAISNAFTHLNNQANLQIENTSPNDLENNLQIGFSIEEMANRAEGQLRSIGLIKNFAPLIYVIAHGSSSANNPHHSAHDCGACSGRPGSVNARVLSFMANHPKVREVLATRGIEIPADTRFVGGLHDTAADEIEWSDLDKLSSEHAVLHKKNHETFENALDLNAKERSRRFASINTKQDLRGVRKAIKDRSVSMFEPRPELGHGTNALCIIGRREMSKTLFLDRRAFLNSYDYRTDLEGKLLLGVMRPIGIVCGGINLEYYFSRVDNQKLGAGTKLPHHVIGLVGVTNSCDGDLRPGLPVQMIEVHDPVRLLVMVEHFPEIVLKTIQNTPEMFEWYGNEWVHIVAIHPETRQYYYLKNGVFQLYTPLTSGIPTITDFNKFVESAREMVTNEIADATVENLPIHSLN
jgi:uncharacterized protein